MWSWRIAVLCAVCLWVLAIATRLVTGAPGATLAGARAVGRDGALRPAVGRDGALRPAVGRACAFGRAAVPYLGEAGTVLALYAVWQVVLDALVVNHLGAYARATRLYRLEQDLHLPSEVSFQRWLLHYSWLVRFFNDYYADVDFPVLCLTLFWLFARHRERYRHYRLTLIASTAICAVIQAIPVAPPRLLPQYGFVDTGLRFGQSVYGPSTTDPGVLTTMPSVHVLWATLVAVVVIGASPSRWRWLVLVDPVLTVAVVVGTGNHFWADGIVADAILAVVLAAQTVLPRGRGDRAAPRHPVGPSVTSGTPDGQVAPAGSMLGFTRRSRLQRGSSG